jgi:hypothetical protein
LSDGALPDGFTGLLPATHAADPPDGRGFEVGRGDRDQQAPAFNEDNPSTERLTAREMLQVQFHHGSASGGAWITSSAAS